jgi:hypothetical protein
MIDLELQTEVDTVRPYAEHDRDQEAFWLHLTEAQAEALASGYVSRAVKAVLRELLDYDLEDQRRAERPVEPKKAKR